MFEEEQEQEEDERSGRRRRATYACGTRTEIEAHAELEFALV